MERENVDKLRSIRFQIEIIETTLKINKERERKWRNAVEICEQLKQRGEKKQKGRYGR